MTIISRNIIFLFYIVNIYCVTMYKLIPFPSKIEIKRLLWSFQSLFLSVILLNFCSFCTYILMWMCIIKLNLLTMFWSVLRDCIKNEINGSYRCLYIGNNEERIVQQFFYLKNNRCGQTSFVVVLKFQNFN